MDRGWLLDSEEKYEIVGPIDQGAFGIVLKATVTQTGKTVAIKRINLARRSKLQVIRELSALRNCIHPNIVILLDAACSCDTMSLIMEYVEYNLKRIIVDSKRDRRDETTSLFFFKQLLQALAFLHTNNVMHRDVKPENVLITSSNIVKLADFGQACLYFPDQPHKEYEEQVGTRCYRAPELLFGQLRYSPAIDWWAAACILAELVNGTQLFTGRSDLEQISSMVAMLGTPDEHNWPDFRSLPDSGKITFEAPTKPARWTAIVPHSSSSLRSLLSSLLQLSASRRKPPNKALLHKALRSLPPSIDYVISPLSQATADPHNRMHTLDSIFADMSL